MSFLPNQPSAAFSPARAPSTRRSMRIHTLLEDQFVPVTPAASELLNTL